jgi:hypothetical protein
MRTIAAVVALLIDLGIFVLALSVLFNGDAPGRGLVLFACVALAFGTLAAAIIAQLLRKPHRALRQMAFHMCWLVPAAWLIGSFDLGIVSGLEILSLVFVAAICGINVAALRVGEASHA